MKIDSNEWHKGFHGRDLVDMQPLSVAERGVLHTVRCLIFNSMGHVLNDDVFLASWCRLKPGRFGDVKARLIGFGMLYVDGKSLRSRQTDSIVVERLQKRQQAQKAGKIGGMAKQSAKRTKVNPPKKDTLAHVESSKPQLFENKEQSESSSTVRGTDSGQTRDRLGTGAEKLSPGKLEKPNEINDGTLAVATIPLKQYKKKKKKEERESPTDSLVDGAENDDGGMVASAVEEAVAIFNAVAAERTDWPKAKAIAPKRMAALAKVLTFEGTDGLHGWRTMLERARESDWLAGRSHRGGDHANWRVSIDYLARVEVFFEVMEGRHDNKPTRTDPPAGAKGASTLGKALNALGKIGAD